MARGENGYITVTAGMPDLAGPRPAGLGRRLGRAEQRVLAAKLRDQGWSYRRISTELAVGYPVVRQWLDGETAPGTHLTPPSAWAVTGRPSMPPPPARSVTGTAPAAHSSSTAPETVAVVERLAAETRLLGEKIERLAAAQAAQASELSGIETRLVETIEAQHRTLVEKILEALRSLVSKLPLP